MIVDVEIIRGGKENLQPTFHFSVLKGIVENNHIQIGELTREPANGSRSFFGYYHLGFRELTLHLPRFVAYGSSRSMLIGKDKSFGFALISSREYSHLITRFQEEPGKVFHVGRFARASHSQVAHSNSGQLGGIGIKQVFVIQHVAQHDQQPIYP